MDTLFIPFKLYWGFVITHPFWGFIISGIVTFVSWLFTQSFFDAANPGYGTFTPTGRKEITRNEAGNLVIDDEYDAFSKKKTAKHHGASCLGNLLAILTVIAGFYMLVGLVIMVVGFLFSIY